jgi:hypothetical protein
METGYSRLLDATVDNAVQLQSTLPPTPGSTIPSLRESNKPVLHKRKRQPYNPLRRSMIAVV